jgi:hypothetical protein
VAPIGAVATKPEAGVITGVEAVVVAFSCRGAVSDCAVGNIPVITPMPTSEKSVTAPAATMSIGCVLSRRTCLPSPPATALPDGDGVDEVGVCGDMIVAFG